MGSGQLAVSSRQYCPPTTYQLQRATHHLLPTTLKAAAALHPLLRRALVDDQACNRMYVAESVTEVCN